ncbi:hypothetical protein IC229_29805 [Spirosoma sp. BT702]|uniref:Uncharacterized protein n=1 Tax=Spirosoma profusum TaxID=2771354 RepID=A0A927AUX4_9BACT|nr:hypothetical protein [Spirosoma profusum]MBD2704864.1 hypothetical protein [Spirosoma profusum]
MTAIHSNDILFDDFSILKELVGQRQLNLSSPTTDCDCIGYTVPVSDDNHDTNQVAPTAGQAD